MSQNVWNDAEISTGFRPIKDGSRYDRYFPNPKQQDKIVLQDGEVEDTVRLMERVVWTYKEDTKQIASLLSRTSTEATCSAIWQFIYEHIQYKLDQQGLEQLRRPARGWADRKTGIDCDCMSIFASSILLNLNIPHSFRITKYSQNVWQHVYVVVPTEDNKYYTIDGVLGQFNYEKTYSQHKDFTMNLNGINIAVLSGVESNTQLVNTNANLPYDAEQAILGTTFLGQIVQNNDYDLSGLNNPAFDAALYQYLLRTRAVAKANPMLLVAAGDSNPNAFIQMLDYAIAYWHTPNRGKAIEMLIANENAMNKLNGIDEEILGGIDDESLFGDDDLYGLDDLEGLGRAKKKSAAKPKKFFKKIGASVKKVGNKIGQTAKKVGKGIIRFNPLTIASRNGFLLALKLNVAKMSEKLKWAYATPQQAAAKRISPDYVAKAKRALVKVEKLFVTIGGKSNNLRKAILNSQKGKLEGIGFINIGSGIIEGLGIAPAAGIAAAVPIITAVISIMKSTGLVAPNEDVSLEPSDDESPTFEQEDYSPSSNIFDSPNQIYDSQEPDYTPTETVDDEPLEGLGNTVVAVKDFISNNPMIALAGASLLAFGLYQTMNTEQQQKATPKNQLAGITKARKRSPNRPKKFRLR